MRMPFVVNAAETNQNTHKKPLASWGYAAVCFFFAIIVIALPGAAHADDQPHPNVLIVEAGLGDYDLCSLHWLGDNVEEVAEVAGLKLTYSPEPAWWNSGGGKEAVPQTFLLGSSASGVVITAEAIAEALDQVRAFNGEGKTVVVGMGPSGLLVREYAEDLAVQKQSSRADIVGLVFCGTPHNGYSAIARYPELGMWEMLAQSIGKQIADIEPESSYLTELNAHPFPAVAKTLTIAGSVGDIGFGDFDGAGVAADLVLDASHYAQGEQASVGASVGQSLNLTSQWNPFASSIDYPDRAIDGNVAERLSAAMGYETSSDVQAAVCRFYQSWFAEGSPVTHISRTLALDLSGSMLEEVEPGRDKLGGAKGAARQYLRAVQAYSNMPQVAPAGISVIGFNTAISNIAGSYDDAAISAIESMAASGETDIGIALNESLQALASQPVCADKRILLLSDGASTQGLSNEEMLTGPVSQAKEAGIVIDAVGFGDVGESNMEFLKQVADATGGTYYQTSDIYSLEVTFMKSYYSSLGLSLIDQEIGANSAESVALGDIDQNTVALGVGLVGDGFAPEASLLCNGQAIDPSEYTVVREGNFSAVQIAGPGAGAYSLQITNSQGPAHVFAVRQQGVSATNAVPTQQSDYSQFLLIGTGALMAIALIAVVVRSARSKGESR